MESVSIFKSVMVLKQSGKLMRKSSGGERAWFLEEESEPRNKRIFLAGENQRSYGERPLFSFLKAFEYYEMVPL